MRGKQDHSRERRLRRGQTDAESRLWLYLRDRRLSGYKFRRQHRIGVFIADLVCIDAKLIVELDGGQHADRETQDKARTAALESLGYRIVRFWNDDALIRTDDVLAAIIRALNSGAPKRG